MMKKGISSVICILITIFMLLSQTASAVGDKGLCFDEKGEFRILIVADTQDIANPQEKMLRLLSASLDQAKPDLVVLLGDVIHGPAILTEEGTKKAIDAVVAPIAERGIPFAVVFGNHDDEGGVSKELQMQWYNSYDGCLAVEGEDMTGCGNYNLLIQDKAGEKNIFNLWFIDSGTYSYTEALGKSYAYVEYDQLAWYERESAALAEQNGGEPIPSFVFQHIPVPEVYDMLSVVPEGTLGAVQGHGIYSDSYYVINPEYISKGALGEAPCPPDAKSGEFDAWKRAGDIVAAFFGHDHVNDYEGSLDGIDMVSTTGTGFFIYGAGENHGTRLVTLYESSPAEYDTEMLYYKDIVDAPLPNYFISTFGAFWFYGVLSAVLLLAVVVTVAVVIIKRARKKRKATSAKKR